MSVSDMGWPTSPLAAADAAFRALTTGPDPLSLDCRRYGTTAGLPAATVSVAWLRDWLLARPEAYGARDAVWRELIGLSRSGGPQWVIAAVGMAMPALRRHAGRLASGFRGDPVDLDAEILTGFLEALRGADGERPAPYAGLCMAAWRAGHALRARQQPESPVADIDLAAESSRAPRVPYGHPDLLVARAVALGLVDAGDAQPYIDVRLGHRAVEPIAARMGISVRALRMRLSRIDERLTAALAGGQLTGMPSPRETARLAAAGAHRRRTRSGRDTETPSTPA